MPTRQSGRMRDGSCPVRPLPAQVPAPRQSSGNAMIQYQTLTEMLDHRSRGAGAIGYLEGEGA